MLTFVCFSIALLIVFVTEFFIEKYHYIDIKRREIALIKKPIVNFDIKAMPVNRKIKKQTLVTGEVVISGDYLKNLVGFISNIFGGRINPFESILDRARREAILRMREKAKDADIIANVRIESIMHNNEYINKTVSKCAILAYGTAITYEEE